MKDSADNVYFGALEPRDAIRELTTKIDQEIDDRASSGHYDLVSRSYNAYYGLDESGAYHATSDVYADGRQGELARISINHYRNLVQHVLVMTTADRPAFEAKATNSDPKSLEQTVLAKGVLEYYLKNKGIEKHLHDAAEYAQICGEGFVSIEWDPTAGAVHATDPETGEALYTGDVVCRSFGPSEVYRDPHKTDSNWDWIIVREWVNRYDMIAENPDIKEELLRTPSKEEVLDQQIRETYRRKRNYRQPSNLIPLYRFYHRRTPTLPEGRLLEFVSSDIFVSDSPLPYKEIPIHRISPADILNSPYGYTNFFDVLSVQKARDTLDSIILSNQAAFGTQLIWVPDGAVPRYDMLAEGLAVVQTAPGQKPEPLQLTSTAKEIFSYRETLNQEAETMSGVSSVTRGQPEASLRTGSALALVQAMSIQFNSGFQRSWVELLERVGTGILHILQQYASAPQIALIVGRHNQSYLKSFVGEDLLAVDRVTVNVGSPVAQTTSGKIDIARDALQNGLIKNMDQYIQVMETGTMEPMVEGQRSQAILTKRENEELAQGINPPVMPIDNPVFHIAEHASVLSSPEARRDSKIAQAAMEHIQQHVDMWAGMDPNLLMALGIPPITPAAPEQLAPQPQMGAGGVPAGAQTAEILSQEAPGSTPSQLPEAPVNPATGQPMNIPIPGGEVA